MALKTPYATIVETDVYLQSNATWLALSDVDKDEHLLNARYYIDSNYTCTELDENDPIPDEYKYANSLLAEFDMVSTLYEVDKTGSSPIVKKMSKAGPVEVETTYAGSRSTELKLGAIDKYPLVTALLDGFCTLNKPSGIKTVDLLRA